MRNINKSLSAGFLILSIFLCGFIAVGCSSEKSSQQQKHQLYTCPMHPSVRLEDPKAPCPICGMKLVPLKQDSAASEMEISFSPETVQRMNFQTMPAQHKLIAKTISLQGKLEYNETRLAKITAWVGGRVDRLYVDYTGMAIKKNEHMLELYSPELISAQQELLQSLEAYNQLPVGASKLLKESSLANYNSAREKLRLLGLSKQQIDDVEKESQPQTTVTIRAPISGIVTSIKARKGEYVKTGTELFTIADLSQLWLILDAYESDLAWIRLGQNVTFQTQALPGKTFSGRVSFISPAVDQQNHTLPLRVNVENAAGMLRPGMLVNASVEAKFNVAGKVISPELKGKWLCPMHPGEVRDKPGKCSICGMDLVQPESIGVETSAQGQSLPLVIPATAVLQTGKRAVVYVEKLNAPRPTYELREVVTGPRVGKWYVIDKGLKKGELVVTSGAFKIDSERQLQGLPSMMSKDAPAAEMTSHREHTSEMNHGKTASWPVEFKKQFGKCMEDYFILSEKLAADDNKGSANAARKLADSIDVLKAELPKDSRKNMSNAIALLLKFSQKTAEAKNIKTRRELFSPLSEIFIKIFKEKLTTSGSPMDSIVYVIRCPMAFDDKGANWLHPSQDVRNPYFGAMMLKCGGPIETFKPSDTAGAK